MDNNELFSDTKELLMQLTEQISTYTLAFNQKDFFTFSDIKERSKLYKSQYYTFIVSFKETYGRLEQCISTLVTLFLEADRNTEEEKANLFNRIFEKHLLLENELNVFINTTEKEIAKDCASVSTLLDSANRLSSSIKLLSDALPS